MAHGDRIARRSGPLPPVEEDTLVLEFGLSHRAVLEFLCGDHFRRLTGGCGPPPTAVAAPTFPPAADRPVSSIQNPAGVSGRTRAPDPSPCLPPDRPVSSFQSPGGRAPSSPARADPAPCTMDARFRMQRCAPTQPADFARAASSPSPQSPARLGSGDRLYKSPSARAILHGPFVRRHQWVCSWYLDEMSHTCMRTCPTVQRERERRRCPAQALRIQDMRSSFYITSRSLAYSPLPAAQWPPAAHLSGVLENRQFTRSNSQLTVPDIQQEGHRHQRHGRQLFEHPWARTAAATIQLSGCGRG